ncbi:MAG: hydrogenase formation protein HypD [Candidatus Diapherotrites archaeon]|nr:hydrogenase formation protein HypD [Candidatus Diapherotrites archaeon]
MCLAVTAKILKLEGNGFAKADFGGITKSISVKLLPQAKQGSFVLVHAGYAIQIVSRQDHEFASIQPLIASIADHPVKEARIMHICGTHEQTIAKSGLRDLLPKGIELISGPGCPVCVTHPSEINAAIEIAEKGAILTSFGDMVGVPTGCFGENSISKAREKGSDVRIVYSISDSVEIARKNPQKQVVHFAIGLETTTPMTASALLENPLENFSVICSHRLTPPAMKALVSDTKIDGFLDPGHVASVVGLFPFREVNSGLLSSKQVPQAVSGFETTDVLVSLLMILDQLHQGKHIVENQYTRVVREHGNTDAKQVIESVFDVKDSFWRGLGKIPCSGYFLKKEFEDFDALKRFGIELEENENEFQGCRCGELLQGKIHPSECPLFGTACKPSSPKGPCMVSSEGTCRIQFENR